MTEFRDEPKIVKNEFFNYQKFRQLQIHDPQTWTPG